MKNSLLILSLFAALVATSFWFANSTLPPITQAGRAQMQAEGLAHSFTDLGEGTVHYRLEGPEQAPTVVLIHGFRTPSYVWNDHIAPLRQAGFRVLSFDNYGRGFSDRPRGAYSAERTDNLLIELLRQLNIFRPVHLVGYSMGGATAAIFTTNHPAKVRSLTLIAPAGLSNKPTLVSVMSAPLLGDAIMGIFGARLGRSSAVASVAESPDPVAFLANYDAQAHFAGYTRALLSTMRHYPLWEALPLYQTIGDTDLPVQIIWGEKDKVVPFQQSAILAEALPNARLHQFPDVGHSITFSRPGDVTPLLIAFVEENRIARTPGGVGGKARGPEARLDPADCLCHGEDAPH